MPKVSILMPVYNGGQLLPEAIKSVLGQDFADWELLVINDGSTDQSGKIIFGYTRRDSRIQQIVHSVNLGLIASLNEGLKMASGVFIARLDSDDTWSDVSKLRKQAAFLEQYPKVGLVGTFARIHGHNKGQGRILKYPVSVASIRKQILIRNCFVHSSVMFRRQLAQQCGNYNPQEKYAEDYGLWLRLGLVAEFCNIPEIMVNYYVNPAGVTQSENNRQILAAKQLIAKFKSNYPNYLLAWLKWSVQGFVKKVF